MKDVYASIVLGIVVTPIFYFLAAFYSGGGHSLTAMLLFFPYGVLCGRLFETTIEWLEPILIILQFPAYGGLLNLLSGKRPSNQFSSALPFTSQCGRCRINA